MTDLAAITAPFFPALADLGEFAPIAPSAMPDDYRTLLAHDDHMTVTVEAFHGSLVDVRVLQEYRDDEVYSRASLLTLQSNGRIVQLGVMRIKLQGLSDAVRSEIESRRAPLGRILIRHNVLRHVELHRLWRILPGPVLQKYLVAEAPALQTLPPSEPQYIYGRSAGIIVEGRPAVELLEIVNV